MTITFEIRELMRKAKENQNNREASLMLDLAEAKLRLMERSSRRGRNAMTFILRAELRIATGDFIRR